MPAYTFMIQTLFEILTLEFTQKTYSQFASFGCLYRRISISVLSHLYPVPGPKSHTPCNESERDSETWK